MKSAKQLVPLPSRAMRVIRNTWGPLLAVAFVGLSVASLLVLPGYIVDQAFDPRAVQGLTPPERLKAENDVRTTLLQGIGGLLLLLGAVATWRQLRLGREQLQHNIQSSQEELHLNREGQITERFTRAIDQLGNANIDVRLGGIYALERIANGSVNDRASIVEILTAYVRAHSPWPPRDQFPRVEVAALRVRAPDVQAAMTVLGRRVIADDTVVQIRMEMHISADDVETDYRSGSPLDLADVDLRKASLISANLAGANLSRSNLEDADFLEAQLASANFNRAILTGAKFDDARLGAAIMTGVRLEAADLSEAVDLEKAYLQDARADLQTTWPHDFDWRAAGVIIDEAGVGSH